MASQKRKKLKYQLEIPPELWPYRYSTKLDLNSFEDCKKQVEWLTAILSNVINYMEDKYGDDFWRIANYTEMCVPLKK